MVLYGRESFFIQSNCSDFKNRYRDLNVMSVFMVGGCGRDDTMLGSVSLRWVRFGFLNLNDVGRCLCTFDLWHNHST